MAVDRKKAVRGAMTGIARKLMTGGASELLDALSKLDLPSNTPELELDELLGPAPGGPDLSEWDMEQRRKREANLLRVAERVAGRPAKARKASKKAPPRAESTMESSLDSSFSEQVTGSTMRSSLDEPAESVLRSAPVQVAVLAGDSGVARLCRLAGTPAGLFVAAQLLGPPPGLTDFFGPPPEPPAEIAPVAAPPPAPMAVPAPPPEELSPAMLFRLAVRHVLADRLVSPDESQFIRGVRRLLKLQPSEELKIVDEEKARARSRPAQTGELEGDRLYVQCYALARRDRVVTVSERHLLDGLAQLFGLDETRRAELESRVDGQAN